MTPEPAPIDFVNLLGEIRKEFPSFQLVRKQDSRLMRVADFLLRAVTLGKQNSFMVSYTTTLGNTVYAPYTWEARGITSNLITLRHERVHMRQRARMGSLRFLLTYALWVFPVVFALGRRNLEQEAYEESIRASVYYWGEDILDSPELRARTIDHFVSADYLWTWPFRRSIEAWYDRVVATIRLERT